jgi:hypothetical protein
MHSNTMYRSLNRRGSLQVQRKRVSHTATLNSGTLLGLSTSQSTEGGGGRASAPRLLQVHNLHDVDVVKGAQQANLPVNALGVLKHAEHVLDLLDGHASRGLRGVVQRLRHRAVGACQQGKWASEQHEEAGGQQPAKGHSRLSAGCTTRAPDSSPGKRPTERSGGRRRRLGFTHDVRGREPKGEAASASYLAPGQPSAQTCCGPPPSRRTRRGRAAGAPTSKPHPR